MSIRTFFDDLLKDLARGGGTIVPAEVATPVTPPAGDPAGSDPAADSVGVEGVPNGDPIGTPPPAEVATPVTPPAGDPAGSDPAADSVGVEGVPNGDPIGTPPPADGEQPGEQPPAADVESLARRLHAELVRADGRVSDPADIPFDPAHLDDQAALTAAIDAAVESRPGIRARQYGGDIGAGNRGGSQRPPVDLIQLMRDIQP